MYNLAPCKCETSFTFDSLPGQWFGTENLIVRHGPFYNKELVHNINQFMQRNFERVNVKTQLDCVRHFARSRSNAAIKYIACER